MSEIKMLPLPRTLQHADAADLAAHVQDFARVLAEIPKPVSPAQREALDELTREAQERGEYGEARRLDWLSDRDQNIGN